MRIIAFCVTLFIGIYVAFIFNSFFGQTQATCHDSSFAGRNYEGKLKTFPVEQQKIDTSRNYTKEEALALVGKRVRNLTHLSAKCPKESGNCLNLFVGETGEVVDILPSLNQTYLLEIQWDKEFKGDVQPYPARFVSRADKDFSFEIIK
jgi:hypothetical protein